MTIQNKRLISLIEFAQQSAKLRFKPASNISQHRQFALHEHQVQGLPGIRLNMLQDDGTDEIWLSIDRIHQTKPPEIQSDLLRPWVEMSSGPDIQPKLRTAIPRKVLLVDQPQNDADANEKPTPEAVVPLETYKLADTVKAQFKVYVDNPWTAWAEDEARRRQSISIYSRLFTLKQQFEGGIVEAQLELVCGVGLGIWKHASGLVLYPLISRLVEVSLNTQSGAIEIKPRDIDPHIEIDWYSSVDNVGVAELEKAGKDFFSKSNNTFSPFDRGTFESLLRTAATFLDPNGIYYPDQTTADDRSLPTADDKLRVTDTWVVFARPRTESVFLQDLEHLKTAVERSHSTPGLPPAVATVVTDPPDAVSDLNLPVFRGLSGNCGDTSGNGGEASSLKAKDLYFPKPFNDEQVRIVQLLEVSDGVVVQGPPGTGKTHTIANVICHYLANGKRVLVTSMKDPALAVLQEQLPPEIRPLAISLLTSEQEGMRQFEFAIQKIASEVQGLDRSALSKTIGRIEESIDGLHRKLASTNREIGDWAKKNLDPIIIDGEKIDPLDAAMEVVTNLGNFEWIPDSLGASDDFRPLFDDDHVVQLREARRILGSDIAYLECALPQIADFPDSTVLLQMHQDLSKFSILSKQIELGEVLPVADSNQSTLTAAQELLSNVERLGELRNEIAKTRLPWTVTLKERLSREPLDEMLQIFETIGAEVAEIQSAQKSFLVRPVSLPVGLTLDAETIEAVTNLSEGRSAFGLVGFFTKSDHKKRIEQVRVLTQEPANEAEWTHVLKYLRLHNHVAELRMRWNALAIPLGLDVIKDDAPAQTALLAHYFDLYRKVKKLVAFERSLIELVVAVFPSWPEAKQVVDSPEQLGKVDQSLRHHLTKARLAQTWSLKERFQAVLEGRKGKIIEDIRQFLSDTLGNPDLSDTTIQSSWSSLMSELTRINGLAGYLNTVKVTSKLIESSGAPVYAERLREPVNAATDVLLLDNWRQCWRLRRLATHLNEIDGEADLKRLAKVRSEVSSDLGRAYEDIVVKRTWLKLAQNASPRIRAALQAYLNAIQKIGKGTGKRAVRFRQDAKNAAVEANPAVPCWIMPHYRVSESLPPQLGCFDLVVIDEASQSDFTALPALLRAQKVLIVGDDKQVSPEGVGLEEEKIRSLMNRFLDSQVPTYRAQMSPDRSMYDLFKVVFAHSGVMLREHFRCVGPIIEFSKREFYNHELRPLRLPRASERLDPPLIDVVVEDGYRDGDINVAEARFIVEEVRRITDDPALKQRSVGIVSLLGDKQAFEIWERLNEEIGPELIERHRIACGDARTFQGKERDIMFLTMVCAPNDPGAPLVRDTFAQRFNVAASRARDRMYLVRSIEPEHLSAADKHRRSLVAHFSSPFANDERRVQDLRTLCESPFERALYDELTVRGFRVIPQVKVAHFRIDLVVEGHNDTRLAVECDGDRYHGPDKWLDDSQRQRVLERAGWAFWRCFASSFTLRRERIIEDLLRTLIERCIDPIGKEGASISVHTEQRRVTMTPPEQSQMVNG